ncbi:MAG: exosortase [Thermodesulfobacteria bacterium]|nr:exosortase [Thermodesulfobacteriota bacterium]
MEAKSSILSAPKTLWLSLSIFFASLLYLYHSVLYKLVLDWWHDPNYSHGLLLPWISLYFVWLKREELARERIGSSWWGLLLVLAGLFLFLLGWIAGELFTQRFSFLVVLYGGLVFLLGWPLARKLLFPVGILVFTIPIPYVIYNALTFPLKLFATKMATNLLQMVGISVYRDGNIIVLPSTTLEVVDACSGIRSLISLLAVCTILSYFVKRFVWKVVLILSAIPVAIGVNVLRIFVTGVLASKYGAAPAEGFFHTFSGLSVFMISLALIFLIHHLVKER